MPSRDYLLPYLIANTIALGLLVLAFRKPRWARWASVAVFLGAALVNVLIGLSEPADYQSFGDLAWLSLYRDFIHGWFRGHVPWLLFPIALGQLLIALLLLDNTRFSRRLGTAGAVIFLLAIAPLGAGSGFPLSLAFGLALVVMTRRLEAAEAAGRPRATRRNRTRVIRGR
jgi:hypothetical protein